MVAEAFPQWAAAPVADAPPGSGPVCRSGALRAPNAEESRRAVAHRAGFDRPVLLVVHKTGERIRPRAALIRDFGTAPGPVRVDVDLRDRPVPARPLHDEPNRIGCRQRRRAQRKRLTDSDFITSHHRGHGHCIAKGVDINAMVAELLGREAGSCRGCL